jgi:single-stranded-DNA-specific exonuclease
MCVDIVEGGYLGKSILVLLVEDIHEGIAGIVAGKLKEKYQRPVILVTPSGDNLKGTGRSVPGINLYELLNTYADFFTRFGGHSGACGFSMEKEMYEGLVAALEDDVNRRLEENPALLENPVPVDMELEGQQITLELAQELDKLAPFGSMNPRPYFMLSQVDLVKVFPMGDGRHVRFTAICGDGYTVDCVLFGKAHDFEDKIYGGGCVDLIGSIDWQEWRGKKRVQFTVEEIR